jgi:hypothetical protein
VLGPPVNAKLSGLTLPPIHNVWEAIGWDVMIGSANTLITPTFEDIKEHPLLLLNEI